MDREHNPELAFEARIPELEQALTGLDFFVSTYQLATWDNGTIQSWNLLQDDLKQLQQTYLEENMDPLEYMNHLQALLDQMRLVVMDRGVPDTSLTLENLRKYSSAPTQKSSTRLH